MNLKEITPRFVEEYGINAIEDVVYRVTPEKVLHLDIALPLEKREKPVPAVIHIHGGAYRMGSYKMTKPSFLLAQKGFVCISIQYRFSYEAHFPSMFIDCKAAVRWLRAHAKELNIDPAHIGAFGESAGGHLSAFLGTCGDLPIYAEGDYLQYSGAVQAVCDCFGPTNFNLMPEQYHINGNSPITQLLGGLISEKQELVAAADPATYIHEYMPPFMFAHGIQDYEVTINQSEVLFNALIDAEYSPEFLYVNNAGHSFKPFGDKIQEPSIPEFYEIMIKFFEKHLK